jgi:hypothetical protein
MQIIRGRGLGSFRAGGCRGFFLRGFVIRIGGIIRGCVRFINIFNFRFVCVFCIGV